MTKKQKYIVILTEGELEKKVIDALVCCDYELKNKSNHDGCITNHYVQKEPKKFKFTIIDNPIKTKFKNYSNLGNVCDINGSAG